MMLQHSNYLYRLGVLFCFLFVGVVHLFAQTTSTATLENQNLINDSSQFLSYRKSKSINVTPFDHTQRDRSIYSNRLNGSFNERIGLGKSIAVMPGDAIKIEVLARFIDQENNNVPSMISNLIMALSGSGFKAGADQLQVTKQSIVTSSYPLAGFSQERSERVPLAYLNWLVFDEHYNLIDGGYKRITNAIREKGVNLSHEELRSEILISNKGYVYTYVSNESLKPIDVFFDDLTVTILSASNILLEDGTVITTETGQNLLTE